MRSRRGFGLTEAIGRQKFTADAIRTHLKIGLPTPTAVWEDWGVFPLNILKERD